MPEGGLSASEVGKEISAHKKHHEEANHHHHGEGAEGAEGGKGEDHERREWVIAVVEASLLALVAVLAAWSGYSSAKWSTESRLKLAEASTARTEANSDQLAAMTQRNFDSSTFTVWFVAYVAGDPAKEAVAERRFTPNFRNAFNAWMATNPFTNPNAPPGPTYMPEYKQPQAVAGTAENQRADQLYDQGAIDGNNSDDYVRVTVYLATVLFLIAIAGHFRIRGVRIGVITVGAVVLVFAVVELALLPLPPH